MYRPYPDLNQMLFLKNMHSFSFKAAESIFRYILRYGKISKIPSLKTSDANMSIQSNMRFEQASTNFMSVFWNISQ